MGVGVEARRKASGAQGGITHGPPRHPGYTAPAIRGPFAVGGVEMGRLEWLEQQPLTAVNAAQVA